MKITTKAVQVHGGYGYTKDYPVERMMRDARSPRSTRHQRDPARCYLR